MGRRAVSAAEVLCWSSRHLHLRRSARQARARPGSSRDLVQGYQHHTLTCTLRLISSAVIRLPDGATTVPPIYRGTALIPRNETSQILHRQARSHPLFGAEAGIFGVKLPPLDTH